MGVQITPKIQEMSEDAFKRAFGDDVDLKDGKISRIVLAYAALLEIGAEYIQLKAWKKVFDHLNSTKHLAWTDDAMSCAEPLAKAEQKKVIDSTKRTAEEKVKRND